MFSHLQVRSAYSLLRGVNSPACLAARAKDLGYDCLALTDVENLYGVHAFIEAAEEAGIRPIIGAELRGPDGRLVALARNREGYGNLCQILSARDAARRGGKEPGAAAGLLGSGAAMSAGLVLASDEPGLLAALVGGVERLYAAITPRSLGAVSVARALGLPLLALGDASFVAPEDYSVHRLLRAIAGNTTLGRLGEKECDPPGALLFGQAEAERIFATYPEALQAAQEVSRLCAFERIFEGLVFPAYASVSGSSPGDELRARAFEGARLRYGAIGDAVADRLEFELGIIAEKGFTDYFLVVGDIVKLASRTCGRGSGAASIVAYCLGITNVDPIRHNLYFQRFLNPARTDPPDIDVDFAWDERDAIIRSVIERFGPEFCARVANHNFFGARSALRETARAYGIPDAETSSVERRYFHLGKRDEILADPLWAEIVGLAGRVEGLPHGLGMHCGGLVITPRPISRYAPVGSSAEGYPLLAWEKEGTEAAGLVKIDLLGNRSLAVIRDALANLAEEGVSIDPYAWTPIEDEDTVRMLARGDSIGVFYIESPAMRQLQKKTGRGDYEHIVIHSSIIRPAANVFINEYVRRLKGGEWEPLHPKLESVFDETYGILCYQEDISKTAVALALFDDGDADRLRKIISKNSGAEKLKAWREKFFAGCRKNGVEEEVIGKVWEMILSFQGYSFCKPHSASYAMVSFQSAWLRAHHPAEFMAAVVSNGGGYYTASAYLSEARRMGLPVAGPDINLSRRPWHAHKGTVVIGFMSVRSLSKAAVDDILAERKARGPFGSIEDFSRRVSLGKDDIIALVSSGSFDALALSRSRPEQARVLLGRLDEGRKVRPAQEQLFTTEPTATGYRGKTGARPESGARAKAETLREEYERLGFLRDSHPLTLWERELERIERSFASEIDRGRRGRITLVGWPVTQKEVLTSEGRPMSFVSFEDETAIYETVLFPDAFERFRDLLFEVRPFIISGMVEEELGAPYVRINVMRRLGTCERNSATD